MKCWYSHFFLLSVNLLIVYIMDISKGKVNILNIRLYNIGEMKRIKIFIEYILRPAWLIFWAAIGLLGHLDTILARVTMPNIVNKVLDCLSTTWLYILLISIPFAVFEGFYRKTKHYLGDNPVPEIEHKFERELVYESGGYINRVYLHIWNRENLSITNCYATLEKATELIKDKLIPISTNLNPDRLPWESTYANENCEIDLSPNPSGEKIMLADMDDRYLKFFRCSSKSENVERGIYQIRIRVYGKFDGREITPFCFSGYLIAKEYLDKDNERIRKFKFEDTSMMEDKYKDVSGNNTKASIDEDTIPITEEEFFRVLNRAIKPPDQEISETSEKSDSDYCIGKHTHSNNIEDT